LAATLNASARRPLRIVIAGGGTGGHISPAIAVLDELRARAPLAVSWMGARQSLEASAASAAGATFYPVRVGKLRRYASLSTLADMVRVPVGVVDAWRILRRLRPDVVFSTGGFVSVPTVVAARQLGIPMLTHEQTAHIGLATRINARFCDVVALSFERSRASLGAAQRKAVLTGNPVRASVLRGDPSRVATTFGVPPELPVLYVTGGAQGAQAINAAVFGALPALLQHAVVLQQCGPASANGDIERARPIADQLPPDRRERYRPVETLGAELADVYAAAALVIGRAGAGTVNELAALSVPALLIPLPGATEQHENARYLVELGAAVMLPQTELSSERLAHDVVALLSDSARLERMRAASRGAARTDAAARLADELLRLANRGHA
jgi:UDP-N-acetylglucosamine--N-acetylmuramyl-(pentapeptide) pyrophosphoryl-undecaprenol N-acetylglucosamine transferase